MTKDEAREAAWWRYVNRCTKVTFSATFYEGFYAGYEAAIAAERSRIVAFEWLEQNASEIRAFVQNPDRNIGVGWPVTISVNKYRGEITFHVSGELPGTATSLLDAIQRASNQCVKGGEDA